MRTTSKWEELIYTNGKQSITPTVNKVIHIGKQSIPNIYIDNNNINTIEENALSGFDLSFMEDTPKERKPRNGDIDMLISAMKTTLSYKGYTYSNIKERIYGKHISGNVEWKALLEESNMT